MTTEGYQCQEMAVLADEFWTDMRSAEQWIQNLKSCIHKMISVPLNVTNMVTSLILISRTEKLTDLALQTIVDISKQDVSQVNTLLYGILFLEDRLLNYILSL